MVRRGLADWVLEFVEFWGGDHNFALITLSDVRSVDDEIENIRSAIEHFITQGHAESCARLIIAMHRYFYLRGRFREAALIGHRALELAEEHPVSDGLRGLTLSSLAVLETMLGNAAHGESLGRKGLSLLQRSPEDRGLIPYAMVALTIAVWDQGRFTEAMGYAEDAYAASCESQNQDFALFALYHIGKLAYLQDDLDRATRCLTESLPRSKESDSTETSLYSAIYLAAVHTRRGNLIEAASSLREADRIWREIGSGIAGLVLPAGAALAAEIARPIDAARIFEASAALSGAIGVNVANEPWSVDLKSPCERNSGKKRSIRRISRVRTSPSMTR